MRAFLACLLVACGGGAGDATSDAPTSGDDAPEPPPVDAPAGVNGLGTVTNVRDLTACPQGAPPNARCLQVTVGGCPGIETETLDAVVAIRTPQATVVGTVVHFSGGGGEGFQGTGAVQYVAAGLRDIQVGWLADWEQTASAGIKTAACRPATILRWVFDEPTLHGGSTTAAFCGEGFSGGSGQLGYALAHYGAGDYVDYVNELSGPPFARIDLGCDGDAPATADVCGVPNTMKLPDKVAAWENIAAPLTCGSTNVPAAELARWRDDSIAIGGVYAYPKTQVRFFDCTNNATAVTAMSKLYFDLVSAAAPDPTLAEYNCYTQADGCQGEALGTGNRDATLALIDNCKPRHE